MVTPGHRASVTDTPPPSESRWRPGIVLDPFIGSGTTALVARKHGRHTIGIELNAGYCEMAAKRLQQLSLLVETRLAAPEREDEPTFGEWVETLPLRPE